MADIDLGPDYHVAQLGPRGWAFQHPLACRPNLLACPFNDVAHRDWTEQPAPLGTYRCDLKDDRLVLSALPDAAA